MESKRLILLLTIAPVLFISCVTTGHVPGTPAPRIKLIYDGDIGPDPCDFSTISMLHEYHNKGFIELLGVIGETPDPYLASTFTIYNRLYGNAIPIAAYHPESSDVDFGDDLKAKYRIAIAVACHADQNKTLNEKYGNNDPSHSDEVMGTVELYRKLLSEAEDNSITIYAAGQLYNFPPLLTSKGDRYSPLRGEELLRTKVKEFVFMGGYFPESNDLPFYTRTEGAEWNWWAFGERNTTKTAIDAIVKMGKPVTYIGAEVGPRVLVGLEMAERLGRDHPTTEAFYLFRPITRLRKGFEEDGPELRLNNPAYDEIALFVAVEGGIGEFFGSVQGRVQVSEKGANTWGPGDGNERYITLLPGVNQKLREVITDRITGKF